MLLYNVTSPELLLTIFGDSFESENFTSIKIKGVDVFGSVI